MSVRGGASWRSMRRPRCAAHERRIACGAARPTVQSTSRTTRIAFAPTLGDDGPAPVRRGTAPPAVGGAGRAAARGGRVSRDRIRRVGAERARGERDRRFQRVETRASHPMRRLNDGGVWELFIPGRWRRAPSTSSTCARSPAPSRVKTDPMGSAMEQQPGNASIVTAREHVRLAVTRRG